jgi:hypothetical protein
MLPLAPPTHQPSQALRVGGAAPEPGGAEEGAGESRRARALSKQPRVRVRVLTPGGVGGLGACVPVDGWMDG